MDDERARGKPPPDEPLDPHDTERLSVLQARTAEVRALVFDVDMAARVIDTAFSHDACIEMGDTIDVLQRRTLAMYQSARGMLKIPPGPLSLELAGAYRALVGACTALLDADERLRAVLRPVTPEK